MCFLQRFSFNFLRGKKKTKSDIPLQHFSYLVSLCDETYCQELNQALNNILYHYIKVTAISGILIVYFQVLLTKPI